MREKREWYKSLTPEEQITVDKLGAEMRWSHNRRVWQELITQTLENHRYVTLIWEEEDKT